LSADNMRFFSRRGNSSSSAQDEAKAKSDAAAELPHEQGRRMMDTVQEDSEVTFEPGRTVGPGSPAYVQPDFIADPPPLEEGFPFPAAADVRRSGGSFQSQGDSEPRGSFANNPSFGNDTRSWGSTTTQFEWPTYPGPIQPPVQSELLHPEDSPRGYAADAGGGCKDTTSFGSVKTEYEWPAYQEPAPAAHPGQPAQMMPPFAGYSMPIPPPGASAQVLAQYAASLQAMATQYSQMASVVATQEMSQPSVGMGMAINPWMLPGQGAAMPFHIPGDAQQHRSNGEAQADRRMDPGTEPAPIKEKSEWVTVMLRNLPNDYSRDDVVELLNTQGFFAHFDFVYLPIDFKNSVGLGYAFINMVSHSAAMQVFEKLSGFKDWKVSSQKVCEVAWGNPEQQGLEFHVTRYRNSPVMHTSVPEEFKPLLFTDGFRVPFPEPTKAPRRPRMKKHARIGCRSPEGSEDEEER